MRPTFLQAIDLTVYLFTFFPPFRYGSVDWGSKDDYMSTGQILILTQSAKPDRMDQARRLWCTPDWKVQLGLAIVWVTNKLYWTDTGTNQTEAGSA